MSEQRKYRSLEEWRKAEGGEMQRNICKVCKRNPVNPGHDTCRECFQKQRAGQTGGSGGGRESVLDGYLVGDEGYFDSDGYLREDLIIERARRWAQELANIGLTTGQIRRFYNHARQAERRMERGESFEAVRPAILEMAPMAADAVRRADTGGRGNYDLFRQFIERNVEQAKKSRKAFEEGFLKHFMYVLAYFKEKGQRGG